MERLVDPVLADLQAEYEQAAGEGRHWRSGWVWILGHLAFIKVLGGHGVRCAIGDLRGVGGEDRRTLTRMFGVCVAAIILTSAVLVGIPFAKYVQSGRTALTVYLIPQALPLTIPFGLALGILCGFGKDGISRASRRIVLLVALVASAGSFVTLGWIMPASNQAYRTTVAGRPLPKTDTELSLGELGRRLSGARGGMPVLSEQAMTRLTVQYQMRWAFACSPLFFSLFALALAGRLKRGRLVLGLAGCAATALYYTIWSLANELARDGTMPAAAAAWAPNVLLGLAAAAARVGQLRTSPPERS
jgi:hypothetical protein